MTRTVTIDPHHPTCRYPDGPSEHAGYDPQRCSYCAACIRRELRIMGGENEDPLDYRHGHDPADFQ